MDNSPDKHSPWSLRWWIAAAAGFAIYALSIALAMLAGKSFTDAVEFVAVIPIVIVAWYVFNHRFRNRSAGETT